MEDGEANADDPGRTTLVGEEVVGGIGSFGGRKAADAAPRNSGEIRRVTVKVNVQQRLWQCNAVMDGLCASLSLTSSLLARTRTRREKMDDDGLEIFGAKQPQSMRAGQAKDDWCIP